MVRRNRAVLPAASSFVGNGLVSFNVLSATVPHVRSRQLPIGNTSEETQVNQLSDLGPTMFTLSIPKHPGLTDALGKLAIAHTLLNWLSDTRSRHLLGSPLNRH